jgi:hypothetical protein
MKMWHMSRCMVRASETLITALPVQVGVVLEAAFVRN